MITGTGYEDNTEPAPIDEESEALEIPERPLAAFSVTDMMDEMRLRYVSYVFIFEERDHDDSALLDMAFHGGRSLAIGLLERAKRRILKSDDDI